MRSSQFRRIRLVAAALTMALGGLGTVGGVVKAQASDQPSLVAHPPSPAGHPIKVTHATRVTVRELPHVSTAGHPAIVRPSLTLPRATTSRQGAQPRLVLTALPAAPLSGPGRIINGFPATSLRQQIAQFPSDANQATEPPDTQVAAGPDQVVEMENSEMAIWPKSGSPPGFTDLNVFYHVSTGQSFGDPTVLFDAFSQRFFSAGMAVNATQTAGESFLAVSATPDPNGAWNAYGISTASTFLDQPKIGVSKDKVVVSGNDFTGMTFLGQTTDVYQKSDLLAGAVSPAVFRLFNADLTRFSLVPATMLGQANTELLVYNGSVVPSPHNGAYLGLVSITGTPATKDVSFTEADPAILASGLPPKARQPSSATIDTGDDRLESAVWQNGTLWTSGNDACTPAGDIAVRSCLRLVQVSIALTMTSTPSVLQDFDAAASGADLFYPALGVDPGGNLATVFSASSSSTNPSLYVATMPAATSIMTSQLLQAGLGPYQWSSCVAGSNRWGDYSGAAVDPSNPAKLWVAGEYMASATDGCDWGTAIGEVTFQPPTSFYFAEGFTGSGFQEDLWLLMPAQSGTASIDYYLNGGGHVTEQVSLQAGHVATRNVNAGVGAGQEVSARVTLPGPGVVERSLHFSFGSWHGSTDVVGVTQPAIEWDFAEGSTLSFFSQYLTLQNPTALPVPVTLNYFTDDGAHPVKTLTLPANSRTTVQVFSGDLTNVSGCVPSGVGANCGVGVGVQGVSTQVIAGAPIVAERPMYVNGFSFGSGAIRDGHDAFGANAAAKQWNFAEGTTLPGFNQYLTLQNPNAVMASVGLRYIDNSGTVTMKSLSIAPQSRFTVQVFQTVDGVGPGVPGVSTQVTSDQPIVAERPMYMVHDFGTGAVAGAHVVVGATSLGTLFGFAAASTMTGDENYLTIQNPNGVAANVTVTYYTTSGTVARTFAVTPNTRRTVVINDGSAGSGGLGAGYANVGIVVASDQPTLVEKPTYSSNPLTYGATDTLGSAGPF